jgi:hypothetical protein
MAHFTTTIQTQGLGVSLAYDYLSDFSSVAEWDPGVSSAIREQPGPLKIGSTFAIEAVFMGRQIPLTYEIVELAQDNRVVLRAENDSIVSLDTLTFASGVSGCSVTYDAMLSGKGVARLLGPFLQLLFNHIGAKAEVGLKEHLAALVPAGR